MAQRSTNIQSNTPPQSGVVNRRTASGSRISVRPSGTRRNYSSSQSSNHGYFQTWQGYDPSQGPPVYPDTSYQAYLNAGGNILGIGYQAWVRRLEADYQTKYNLYQQWYESTPQQLGRIEAAGLNTNLAYGMASPGGAAGQAPGFGVPNSVMDVAAQGAQALSGVAGSAKTLAETAALLYEMPASKFKGNLSKALDVAAAAEAFNSGKQFEGLLNQSRILAGTAGSQAKREHAQNRLGQKSAEVETQTLEYLSSRDSEGNETDFEGSLYAQSAAATKKDALISYYKHQKEWTELLSNPNYWKALLKKAQADGDISYAQAWKVNQILSDPNMDDASKVVALQEGIPGFFAKVAFEISSKLVNTGNKVLDFLF